MPDHEEIALGLGAVLDPHSSEPLFVQLSRLFSQRILTLEWKPGAALPSERELCDEFNVSRGTARQALAELEKAGIVYRKQGIGTFVSTLDHQHATVPVDDNALVRDMGRQGIRATVTLLEVGFAGDEDAAVRSAMRARARQKVIRVKRCILGNGEPWMLDRLYLPNRLALDVKDYAEGELCRRLAERHSAYVCDLETEVRPTIATASEAAALGVEAGSAGLTIERRLLDHDRRVLALSQAFYRGDRCHYYFRTPRRRG